jgi:RNA:NAD 2'-phosphotransferase (TPT1/KptA family)
MILSDLDTRSAPTFYKSQKDLDIAVSTAVEVIRSAETFLPKKSEGYFPITYICSAIKEKHPFLSYINRNHIVEFFFKDLVRKVSFKDEDYIQYECSKLVDPSEILHVGRPFNTLFSSLDDLNTTLITTVHLLRDNTANLSIDDSNYYLVDDVCKTLKKRMPFLSYIDKNHLLELFFKDKERKIIFKDQNLMKYKLKIYLEPPETLYFGTLTNLALKMKDKGIFSSTKKYVKLYADKEQAIAFAKKFILSDKDTVSVLVIEAKKAYETEHNLRFSTYNPGEYIVTNIKKEYIKEIL